MNSMEFSDWITQKFITWRGERYGNSASVAEFAKQFGASHQLVLGWMKKGGKKPKHAKYINALVTVYGKEVYDVLGLDRPVLEFTPDSIPLASLPPAVRKRFQAAFAQYEAALAQRGLTSASPEAPAILIKVFAEHGLNIASIVNDDGPSLK